MTSLPRATCSACGRLVPVRVNGTAREHRTPYPFRIPDGIVCGVTCAGSGKPTRPIGAKLEFAAHESRDQGAT